MYLIAFETKFFTFDSEPEHPINPIPGCSVAQWLEPILQAAGLELSGVRAEQWGWAQTAKLGVSEYQIGYSAMLGAEDEPDEITIRVEKYRSRRDRLLFRNRFNNNDRLLNLIVAEVDKLDDVPGIQIARQ